MERYNEKVLRLFLNPINVGRMEDADVTAIAGSVACGDMIKLYLKFDESGKRISKATFESYGCAANIATASMLTILIENKEIEEVEKITFKDIVEELGGLPKIKYHCAALAVQGLKVALLKWKIKKGEIALNENTIREILRNVLVPYSDEDIVSAEIYKGAEILENKIIIKLMQVPQFEEIKSNVIESFEGLDYEIVVSQS